MNTAEVSASLARVREATVTLNDVQVRAPCELPDWTRGHVLAHLTGFARAARRQIEYALQGERIEFYDGGRPGRSAEIEENGPRPAVELTEALTYALDTLEEAWRRVESADWTRRVSYRDGTLVELLHCCWREAEIHLVDLDIGVRPAAWSTAFCGHTIDFLSPRVPADVRLELEPTDDEPIVIGDGRLVSVGGTIGDLTAWLAGRRPSRTLRCSDTKLPELGPWP